MRKYEAPKINVIKLEETDIIQTSGLDLGGDTHIPGTGIIVPIPGKPKTNSLDSEY